MLGKYPVLRDPYRKYIRLRHRRYQVRIRRGQGPKAHVNLGLYATEWEARRVAQKYLQTGEIPSKVLPKWVRWHAPTATYFVSVRIPSIAARFGAYATAAEAHEAAVWYVLTELGAKSVLYLPPELAG